MFSERATPDALRSQQERKIQDACAAFFTEAIAVPGHPTHSEYDKRLRAVIDRFRDFLADEQEGDDAVIAREIRSRLTRGFEDVQFGRFNMLHLLCESAPIMSAIELDELKRFAATMYFDDADKLALEKAERKRFAHMLRDAITAAEGLHDAPVSHEEGDHSDDLLAREYNTFLETLAFDDAGDELRDMYRLADSSGKGISSQDRARVLEILRDQAVPHYRAELLVRGMRFFVPDFISWKAKELGRLRALEKVEIPQEDIEELNIVYAVDGILSGEATYFKYRFDNFFPSREHAQPEEAQKLIVSALDRLSVYLCPALARLKKRDHSSFRIARLFDESTKLFDALFRYISPIEESAFEQRLQEIFRKEGGKEYAQYLERKQRTDDPEPVHSDVEEHESKPEEPDGPLVPEREQMLLPDKVIERIRARGLLHLSEEIREHPDRFAAALKDLGVQRVAREAILQALQQERFGIAERAGPVFLGKDWRKEHVFQEVVRAFLLDQRRMHYFTSSVHPLPLAVLQKKAEDFGFSWDDIEEKARKPPRKHKRT